MIAGSVAERVKNRLGFDCSFGVNSNGRSGGLCVYWQSSHLDFQLISFSSHHICGDVTCDNGVVWRFVGLYGWPDRGQKAKTWELMRSLCEYGGPMLLGGDFNEVLSMSEVEGSQVEDRRVMHDFRACMDDLQLRDLGFSGCWFTWERGTNPATRIRERLDRFVASSSWTEVFPEAYVEHMGRYKSDHTPIMVCIGGNSRRRRKKRQKRFRFETAWLLEEECEPLVRKAWAGSVGESLETRLSLVARDLTVWSKDSLDVLGKKISVAEDDLKRLQQSSAEIDRDTLRASQTTLDTLLEKQEAFWFLRSRVSEIRDGDKNTKYFHHKASQRQRRNYIPGLFDALGVWREDEGDIEKVVADYYQELFTSSAPSEEAMLEVLNAVVPTVTAEMNAELGRACRKEEVWEALRQMHPSKAPGPDGMHAVFYQRFWHIVGDDVTDVVSGIIHGTRPPDALNKTNIVLIPKVKSPTLVSEFRPISLCNVIFKLVTKVLANRLKLILPNIVSDNQSAFVPGRLITDNALIALELFHSMKYRCKGNRGFVAMKLDMSKAYDRVEWVFLRGLLEKMGFDGAWVRCVMDCVSSVRYSFVVNGDVCGFVTPSRGLRQGDPMSPYLFIFVADAFSALIRKATEDRRIHGMKASRNGPEISHLLFADDSLLFARACRQECAVIVDILNKYEAASGQKINIAKSEVSFSKGVSSVQKEEIVVFLAMRQVDRHSKYLGIPTLAGRSKQHLFSGILDRVWKKLQGWKEKLLSRAGKEVLLKAVIQAIPTYVMGVYRLPGAIIQSIHSAMARFWWGNKGDRRSMHWKSWANLCNPKCLGGMGFRDLSVFNEALLGRQAWRLIQCENSLLSQVIKAKYYPKCSFLEASLGFMGSYSWRSIWGAKALVKEGIVWRVGTGEKIKIWEDPWVHNEESRFILGTRVQGLQFVGDLIDRETREWKLEVVREAFNEQDGKAILAIPLSECPKADRVAWAFTKDGNYSVKTAYMVGKSGNLDLFHRAWVKIWSLEVSPKVRHFLWKVCSNSLPVRATLKHRHILEDDTCPLCLAAPETTSHALLHCSQVQEVWESSGMLSRVPRELGDDWLEFWNAWQDVDEKWLRELCYIAYYAWHRRNKVVFEGRGHPNDQLLEFARSASKDYNSYAKKIYGGPSGAGKKFTKTWQPPPPGCVKINADASCSDDGWVGLGVVARDEKGDVLFAATRRVRAWWPIEVAEGKGLCLAIKLARNHGFKDVIFETDCLTIFNRLSRCALFFSDLDTVLEEALFWSRDFYSVKWSHVLRDGNFVAHHLARLLPFGVEQRWEYHCPVEVAPYVHMDKLSID
ncbi:uncharacterized protein LOC125493698 [Beta vulgaris subsp. vulgaris]|uniref:uncharacterized protein LOC125493698 n=1 Tax=Beta vulgaris subsp. vulgaris TaxID=3555 RepID=UPI002036B949|nr:uncharacterized protein LOC125493698 [Beta vulgaris subsp. vulgaris]